jgi:hypothetical protein
MAVIDCVSTTDNTILCIKILRPSLRLKNLLEISKTKQTLWPETASELH